MKKINLLLVMVLAIAGLTFASCGQDNNGPEKPNSETPGGNNEDPNKPDDPNKPEEIKGTAFEVSCADANITWSVADTLGIFPADGLADKFTVAADAIKDGKATFTNAEKLESDTFYAVYPYNAKDLLIGNVLTTIVPFEHSVSNVGTHNLSVAKVSDKAASLKNVLGFIKLNVTDADLTEIVIRSIDSKSPLAGKVEVTIPDSGNPTVQVLDGVPFITLVPAAGQTAIPAGTYMLPVLPGAMNQGVSIRAKVHAFDAGTMYVKEIADAQTSTRAAALDLGTVAKTETGFDTYKEWIVNDDASGFGGCYREFGTKSIDTNPNRIYNLGDYDDGTYWNMPPGVLNGGNGEAYDIDGNKTIRGSYLRLEFHKASGKTPTTQNIYFEYTLAHDPDDMDKTQVLDWAPWTLDVREYGQYNLDGAWKYGTLQHLTVENDALPWTAEYNNRYVSNVIRPVNPDRNFDRLILCCTRTRWNDDHELKPKDAVEGVTFKNLVQETPESRWALAELHVWMKPIE
ncbi:MAG: hypothetical protein IJS07_05205 [Bacteroidales bacterium]|nr:hypothetical protein [Bacteroidales bacterium]